MQNYLYRYFFLFLALFFSFSATAQNNRKWLAKDTAYVLSPAYCHFYKKADTTSDRFFTLVYSSKVVILENRAASPEFSMFGTMGQLRKVEWGNYKGYVFDGFLTHLYVCRFEGCRRIEDAFDVNTIREYSTETPLDCPPNASSGLPDSLWLFPTCDSFDIHWRNGVKYNAYQSPKRFHQSYVIPKAEAQEIFQWAKLMYKELKFASLSHPEKEVEELDGDQQTLHSFKYVTQSNTGKLSYFTANIRKYNKAENRLISNFSFKISSLDKNSIQVTVEKNMQTQIIIKDIKRD
jgi:hypothetical protein